MARSDEPALGEWTEALTGEFLAGLEPVGRGMALHVWRAGEAGIHQSVLCQRLELTPCQNNPFVTKISQAARQAVVVILMAGSSPLRWAGLGK